MVGPVKPAKHRQALLIQIPCALQVVAELHAAISQVCPWKPVGHVHVPSPTAGELVVTHVPPFLQIPATLQKAIFVAHVGPLKLGAHLQLIVLVVGKKRHVPWFWQKVASEAGQAWEGAVVVTGARVVVVVVVVVVAVVGLRGGRLQ